MASLADLRSLVWVYLGTTPADPAYPSTTVTLLLNAVASKYVAELRQQTPGYLSKTATLGALDSTSHDYALPMDFGGWLDVRQGDARGARLVEVRGDERNMAWAMGGFSITGPDNAATLTTTLAVPAGVDLYLMYSYVPPVLAADADSPVWMPAAFHDLLAREAAIDAYGLGNESAPAPYFVAETQDRRAVYWSQVGRRGVALTRPRAGSSNGGCF